MMKHATIRRLTQFMLTAFALCLPGVAGAQMTFNSIVVFGTSLSDPGNAYALLTRPIASLPYLCSLSNVTQSLPPYQSVVVESLYPCAPYAIGGHHFSNGATWIEQLAEARGLAVDVEPAFQGSNAAAHNYAVGGARAIATAVAENGDPRVNLPQQVQTYLTAVGDTAPADALYVIEIGNNDVGDALRKFVAVYAQTGDLSQAQAAAQSIIGDALISIGANIQALYAAGARKFLVSNAADFDLIPIVTLQGPQAIFIGSALSEGFNMGLANLLTTLRTALPGVQIAELDLAGRMGDIYKNPPSYGLVNVTGFCITPNVAPFMCEEPSTFLFWDGIHPTYAVHGIIAHDAESVLASYQ